MEHLVDINFERSRPHPALQDIVEWYWQIESPQSNVSSRQEFLHGISRYCLLFNWGRWKLNSEMSESSGLLVLGAGNSAYRLQISEGMNGFGVLLQPWAAAQILKTPANIYDRSVVSVELNNVFASLNETLFFAPNFSARCKIFNEFLIKRLSIAAEPVKQIKKIANIIVAEHGNLSVQSLSDRTSIERRRLERLFAAHLGMSPKRYANFYRMEHARSILKANCQKISVDINASQLSPNIVKSKLPLANIALDSGFSDQAHFNRTFKSALNMTPGEYIKHQVQRIIRLKGMH